MASGTGAQYLKGGGEQKIVQWLGIYQGYIAVNQDPLDQGRVKLRVPQVFGGTTSGWAAPMVPLTYIPQVSTPVAVMFLGGDTSQPVWLGNFALPDSASGFVFAATEPPSPTLGEIWVNTTTGLMSEYNGAGWVGYQIGGAAIQTGAALTEPDITGGTITGAVFKGTNWVENSYGSFLYSGTPAAGNLILSLAPTSGNDQGWTSGAGNNYNAGLQVIGESGGSIIIDPSANSGVPYISLYPLGATKLTAPPQIYGAVLNAGAANESEMLVLYSGQSQTGNKNAALQLFSDPANATSQARANFVLDGASTSLTSTLAQAYLPATQGQWADNACTTTSMSKLSSIWSIPANDPNVGTSYRLKGYGYGLQNANAFSFQVTAFGAVVGSLGLGAVAFPSGANSIDFEFEVMVAFGTVGSSGTASASIKVTVSQAGVNVGASPGGSQFTVSGAQNPGSTQYAVNTTAGSNITLQASVSSTTNSPFIECTYNTLERIGP